MENYLTDGRRRHNRFKKLIRRNDYHIIIFDANIPELDAWHARRQIRKASAPIIMISKQSDEQEKLYYYIGVDDFINKPFSNKELMARITSCAARA